MQIDIGDINLDGLDLTSLYNTSTSTSTSTTPTTSTYTYAPTGSTYTYAPTYTSTSSYEPSIYNLNYSDLLPDDTDTSDLEDYLDYVDSLSQSGYPSVFTSAYYEALSRDEQQYGASAEYRKQFFRFIQQLSNQIYNAIANGETTITRGSRYQPYPDNPSLASATDNFFNAIFGSDGEANAYEVANSDLYGEAVREYNSAPYYYDFAATWEYIDTPTKLIQNAETANQERLDAEAAEAARIAAEEEAERQRLAEIAAAEEAERQRQAEEAERQRQAEEAAARQAALDNADSIFRTAGYNPNATEVATFADNPDGIADYIDPRQITEAEAKEFFENLGYEPNAQEVQDFVGQGGADFESTRSGELGTYVDEHQVTRAELEQIAAEQGYELDPDDDYGQYIRQGADINQADIKATAERDFDAGSVSVSEIQEIYKERTGQDLSAAEAAAMRDLVSLEGDGSGNVSEEDFGEWAVENIEADLRGRLETLTDGVLDILFGSTDVEEILQQQLEILLPPSPSDPNYEEKYNEWLKRQGDAIISINNSPATSGTWAGIRFPVPIPVSGPEIMVPIFDANGNYIGPASLGELLVGEDGVITQGVEGVQQAVGRITEQGAELFGEEGVVAQVIDLGQATIDAATGQATFTPENPDIQFNEETGQIIQPETEDSTGLPLDEKEDEAPPVDSDGDGIPDRDDLYPNDPTNTVPNADAIETGSYGGMGGNDADGDGIPNDQDQYPNDPTNTPPPSTDVVDEDPPPPVEPEEDPEERLEEPDPVDPNLATQQDVQDAKDEVLDALENSETGLRAELEALGLGQDEIENIIGSPAQYDTNGNLIRGATGVYADIENAASVGDLAAVEQNLVRIIGQPATADSEATGLYERLADLGYDVEDVEEAVGNVQEDVAEVSETVDNLGQTVYSLAEDVDNLDDRVDQLVEQGATQYEALDQAIQELSDKHDVTTTEILDAIGESESRLSAQVGLPAVADDPNTPENESRPATGLYAEIAAAEATITADISDLTDLVMAYEADGIARDEAITLAVNDLSADLGLTRDELLTRIGESESSIMDAIGTSQAETNQYLDYISSVIGRPASELTQDDVDAVVSLLAEDETISEFNNDLRLYDVNFDGQINQTDIDMLQGFVNAGVEGVGEIPATGLYGDAARRQEEITGAISDEGELTRGLISDTAAETQRLVGMQNLFNTFMGSGDLLGQTVTEKTPDPVELKYVYGFEDIFATPQQRGLFPSPYGAPQRQAAQQIAQQRGIMSGPLQLGGLQRRPGMAAGGKVDYDLTDEIMHIMGYGDS